jgi:hypothetical protein
VPVVGIKKFGAAGDPRRENATSGSVRKRAADKPDVAQIKTREARRTSGDQWVSS